MYRWEKDESRKGEGIQWVGGGAKGGCTELRRSGPGLVPTPYGDRAEGDLPR